MVANHLPPVEFLRECFSYDPLTGEFRWLKRPVEHFANLGTSRRWNSKMAGKRAFPDRGDGYAVGGITYEGQHTLVLGHRVAWKMHHGEEPPEVVDHRDKNPSNNRISNLRAATMFLNHGDEVKKAAGLLPKGVHKDRSKSKFVARIRTADGRKSLGTFKTPEAAHAAYCEAGKTKYGEFFGSAQTP